MRFTKTLAAVVAATLLAATSQLSATPIFDEFGPLDMATFGGQGIPNDEVAVSRQFFDGDNIITVAMSATQRFSNPALTNDGAGTYFATTGSNFGGNNESGTEGALWNFNYYIMVEGLNGALPVLADYQIDLFYDFDTALDNAPPSLGSINVTNAILAGSNPSSTLEEGSQNLLFGFLANPVPGFISPPAGAFDPNALGEYNFGIQVTRAGWSVETVAMDVQVIPEPTSLVFLAVAGVVAINRRRR